MKYVKCICKYWFCASNASLVNKYHTFCQGKRARNNQNFHLYFLFQVLFSILAQATMYYKKSCSFMETFIF